MQCFLRQAIQKDILGNPWNADLDFLAVDFEGKRILLIEVGSSSDYRKVVKIVERLAESNCKNIESYVQKTILQKEIPSFAIVWCLFVRNRHVEKWKKEPLYMGYLKSGGPL